MTRRPNAEFERLCLFGFNSERHGEPRQKLERGIVGGEVEYLDRVTFRVGDPSAFPASFQHRAAYHAVERDQPPRPRALEGWCRATTRVYDAARSPR